MRGRNGTRGRSTRERSTRRVYGEAEARSTAPRGLAGRPQRSRVHFPFPVTHQEAAQRVPIRRRQPVEVQSDLARGMGVGAGHDAHLLVDHEPEDLVARIGLRDFLAHPRGVDLHGHPARKAGLQHLLNVVPVGREHGLPGPLDEVQVSHAIEKAGFDSPAHFPEVVAVSVRERSVASKAEDPFIITPAGDKVNGHEHEVEGVPGEEPPMPALH